jgi:hypothetical protein
VEQELRRKSSDEQLGGRGSFGASGGSTVRRREGGEDPWHCGPGFCRVCLCRGMVEPELSRGTGTVKRPAQRGSVRVSSGHVRTRKQHTGQADPSWGPSVGRGFVPGGCRGSIHGHNRSGGWRSTPTLGSSVQPVLSPQSGVRLTRSSIPLGTSGTRRRVGDGARGKYRTAMRTLSELVTDIR